MDLGTHIRDIWIAVGVLSALGILLAFIQTSVWQSRSGKEIIDLVVRIHSNMRSSSLNSISILFLDYRKTIHIYL